MAALSSAPLMLEAASHPVVWPGDWEQHDAVWLAWSPVSYARGRPLHAPFAAITAALRGRVRLCCLVDGPEEEAALGAQWQLDGAPPGQMDIFHIRCTGPWTRDFGPLFVRCSGGRQLAVVDFDFNSWGYAEWDDELARLDEAVHRSVAAQLGLRLVPVAQRANGMRAAHEGGGVVLNGSGTLIAVESVAMQRNLGPSRFYAAEQPVTDWSSPTTYRPSTEWEACKQLMEEVYASSLGARKVIWLPTGVIEDDAPFRGPVAAHLRVVEYAGRRLSHAGVYPSTTTNGHADEFVRFIAEDTVLLAQSEVEPLPDEPTPLQRVLHFIEQQNHDRLERAYAILSQQSTADGRPLKVVRMPVPCVMLELLQAGDLTFDRLAALQPWDESRQQGIDQCALVVLPASYCNYFVTNGVVLVPRYWKEGRPQQMKVRDAQAALVLSAAFPDREVVAIVVESINLGGGGMHCITQQQPSLTTRTA